MTKLNVYELLVLHLNVNRKLGDEIKHHNFILEHRIDVMKIIQKLIDNQLIYTTNAPNVALNYLKVNELKVILRDNKLKLSGNKAELIDRLINSLDDSSFNLLDLPQIYKATSLGKNILEETEYIIHFYPHHSITIIDAYNVVQNADEDIDKIEFIYNFYIYVKINENNFDSAGHYAERLSHYYLIENPNEIKRRIYINLSIYLIGMNELFRYNKLAHFNYNLRDDYRFNFYEAKTFYEKPLLVDNINKNILIEEYLHDIRYFIDPDLFLATKFIKILFAKMEKNYDDLNKQYTDIEKHFNFERVKETENEQKVIQYNDVETRTKSGCLFFVLFPLLPLLNYLL
ncbi:SAP domain-containing protein [Mammaliicoccus fleurettii]|uniref:SAP domain-containing protein n=1 Tax=Mammaliicoccus fleurettii TaxID=150056 RepID=UPI002DBEC712|nr:SAP domain-containing protein [Mammaliicoccus fleurettii]MEB7723438.1 SAP domain-containing protein [Mammaliicoccus fleurettii]